MVAPMIDWQLILVRSLIAATLIGVAAWVLIELLSIWAHMLLVVAR
jgi:hypothetical protein